MANLPDEKRLVSLSFSDLVNMTLLGDESFYRCEPADAAIERLEADNARLQELGNELSALLEEARNERDMYKQQIERIQKETRTYRAGFEGALRYLAEEVYDDVRAPFAPKSKGFTPEYRNDLASMRAARAQLP